MQRDASVLDGENAGRLKNGDMTRDIIGILLQVNQYL